jgi:hypothetical protein
MKTALWMAGMVVLALVAPVVFVVMSVWDLFQIED